MKKTISLILALVLCLCLSLCACSKNNIAEEVVGVWTGTYVYQGDRYFYNGIEINPGDNYKMTINIFKGGAVEIINDSTENDHETTYTGTWEISDDVLVIAYTPTIYGAGEIVVSWEIDIKAEPSTLTLQGSNKYFPKTLTK